MTPVIEQLKEKLEYFRTYKKEGAIPVSFRAPVLSLLDEYKGSNSKNPMEPSVLESKLLEFGFQGKVVAVRKGPIITRYEIKLAPGIRLSQVRNISEDLAIALMSKSIRIQAPIPGTSLVGVEVANENPDTIGFREIIRSILEDGLNPEHQSYLKQKRKVKKNGAYQLPMAIGVDIVGKPKIVDLAKMPHLLIAGQTGSGKSVCLNGIICSLLYTKTPEECKLVLVDPKRVEMTSYTDLPHLWVPVITESEDALEVFDRLTEEMEKRYQVFTEHKVRNIVSFNNLEGVEKMPYIVAVIDEMADLIMTSGKELEAKIVRLAQLSRAVGIHLILATQKPVVKVITGLIKSNMPSRISFQVASKMDSRVILDTNGAERLIGRGDMLMIGPGSSEPERFHGAWLSDQEIEKITGYLKYAS